MVLEGLYMSKLQDSVQLQTVLALYDQETVRNNGQTRYWRLRTSVRLFWSNDENLKLQSPKWKLREGQYPRVKKQRKTTLKGKWKNANSSKGDSCSFSHDTSSVAASGNGCKAHRAKRTIDLSRTKIEGQDWRWDFLKKFRQTEEKALQTTGAESRADTENVTTRHVIVGILPCVKITSLHRDAKFGAQCLFRCTEADGQPSKKSKKGGAQGSVALLKESIQLGCVSQDSYPRKSFLGNMGSMHAVNFSKGTWHQIKIRERKGPSWGIIQKCAPRQRSPSAPKFEERSHEQTWHQERCAAV